jgi:hypothetical protein
MPLPICRSGWCLHKRRAAAAEAANADIMN